MLFPDTVAMETETDDEEFIRSEFKSCEQISDELVTLSLLPNSRWQNLLNLDIIKVGHADYVMLCFFIRPLLIVVFIKYSNSHFDFYLGRLRCC